MAPAAVSTVPTTAMSSACGRASTRVEIIDHYCVDRQGPDVRETYRTGVYSQNPAHLAEARAFIDGRSDAGRIVVEVLPLTNFICSADEHQDHLARCPDDPCHIPRAVLTKYRR